MCIAAGGFNGKIAPKARSKEAAGALWDAQERCRVGQAEKSPANQLVLILSLCIYSNIFK